jgi:hypothetical protein
LLSFPIRPDSYAEFNLKFPHFPSLIINEDNCIIFGIDSYHYYLSKKQKEAHVFKIPISKKDALFLNFNLKERFFGCNLYEKLIFLKKVIPFSGIQEIYEKTTLALPINQEVLKKLPLITNNDLKNLLINERISLKAALKICNLAKKNRLPIIQLFDIIQFSSSNQLAIIDMIEEIVFRDKTSVENIFRKLNLKHFFFSERSQEKIMNKIQFHRYPEYQKTEQQWRAEIKKLKLAPGIQVKHSRFFEKKQIELTVQLQNLKSVKDLIKKLKK